MLAMTGDSEVTGYWRKIFVGGRQIPWHQQVGYEFLKFAWGWTPGRTAFSCLVFGGGVVTTVILARRKKEWLLPLGSALVGIALAVLALISSVWDFGLRRASVVWPPCFILLALGLYGFWLAGERGRRFRVLRWVGMVPTLAAFGLWIHADTLVLKVNGFDVPYRWISDWLDRTFPKGTPVLTDRFFTAMCEFNSAHPTTNVVVISTVPNELPEIQEKNHFRDLTRRYLEDNPDAVFYCGNHWYWDSRVTPWDWPVQYFKQHKEFIDLYTRKLGLMGQSYWFQHSALATLRPTVVYYNTLDDVIEMKRRQGESAFVVYGPDWRPVQTQDYRLWRLLLSGDASLRVYGVGSSAQDVTVELTGVAVGGDLRIQLCDQTLAFPSNQIVQQRYRIKLQPGMNTLPVRCRGAREARLLIGRAVVGEERQQTADHRP